MRPNATPNTVEGSLGGQVVAMQIDSGSIAHIMSVPTDCSGQKMRVSRYTVLADAKAKRDTAVVKVNPPKVVDVTKAIKTDTRDNHKSQKRDRFGRFLRRV